MADSARRSTRFSMRSKQLGQLLLENGDVQSDQIAEALKTQEQSGGLLGQVLQQSGACNEHQIAAALLKQVQVTDVKCDELTVAPEVSQLVERAFCEAERLCPFERLGNLLCVVMGNPLNRRAISQIEDKTRFKVKSFKSVWPKISEMIQRSYGEEAAEEVGDATQSAPEIGEEFSLQDPEPLAGIQEIDVEEPAPRAAAPKIAVPQGHSPRPREQQEAKIQGFENLDDANAEVIETNRRGLTQRVRKPSPDEPAPKPKVAKKLKINVDLDALDISSGETIKTGGLDDDGNYEEIGHGPAVPRPVRLKLIEDTFFYEDGKAPQGERSDDLLEVITALPVAQVIAESIGDYHSQHRADQKSGASKSSPRASQAALAAVALKTGNAVELQQSPVAAVAAIAISEIEFKNFVSKLGEDPIGEWDWAFAAPGPISVLEYEES